MLARRITIDERALESRSREVAALRLALEGDGAVLDSPARSLHALIEQRLTTTDDVASDRLSRGAAALTIAGMSGGLWAAIAGLAALL